MLEPHPPERTRAPPSPDATPPFTLATQDTQYDTTQTSENRSNHIPTTTMHTKRQPDRNHFTITNAKKCRTPTDTKDIRNFFTTNQAIAHTATTDTSNYRHDKSNTHKDTKRKATIASALNKNTPSEPSNTQSLQKFLIPQESTQQPHIPKPYLDAILTKNEHRAPKPVTPHHKHNKQPSPNSHAYFLRPHLDLSNHMTFNSDITRTWRASDEVLF